MAIARTAPKWSTSTCGRCANGFDGSGRVLDSTRSLPSRPLLDPSTLAAARRGAPVTPVVRLVDEPVRLLAETVRAQDQKLVIVVAQSLQERKLALSELGGDQPALRSFLPRTEPGRRGCAPRVPRCSLSVRL